MIIIPIRRSTIREAVPYPFGLPPVEFTIKGTGPIPVQLTERGFKPHRLTQNLFSGEVLDYEGMAETTLMEWLSDNMNALFASNLVISGNRRGFPYFPARKHYTYGYLPAKLRCGDCGSLVRVDDIEEADTFDGDGMEPSRERCPICSEINSFPDYRYERIEEVMRQT